MLRYLQIRDFAIIDAVELEFRPGLTVLTGETGAGKSIVVDALELLCGSRASADVVRAGAERADICATVDIGARTGAAASASAAGGGGGGGGSELRELLEQHSIAAADELLLRRVIGSDGRSRAWVNGQTVPLQVLAGITGMLFEIHGQHEFQSLVRPATQRELVDAYGRLESLAMQVRSAHTSWLALLNRSIELDSAASEHGSRLDLLRYQLHELDTLQLKPGEIAELRDEHSRLANRGRLIEAARGALECLYEAEGATAHTLIARSIAALRQASGVDSKLAPVNALLEEASIRSAPTPSNAGWRQSRSWRASIGWRRRRCWKSRLRSPRSWQALSMRLRMWGRCAASWRPPAATTSSSRTSYRVGARRPRDRSPRKSPPACRSWEWEAAAS